MNGKCSPDAKTPPFLATLVLLVALLQTVFTGALIVVPDSSALARAGEATVGGKPPGKRGTEGPDQGVTGLKKMGVKELTYR